MMQKLGVIIIILLQLFLVSCDAQLIGCTDPLANNYVPSATVNDGSCTYDLITVSPTATFMLGDKIPETSGLLIWDNYIWTHNDSEDPTLYGLDMTTGEISIEYLLEGVLNTDWEEISQDRDYLYVGDVGNNTAGNRTDLHLLRIQKSSLKEHHPKIDTIWFTYSDQVNFDPTGANQTDYDCEAFIVSEDSLYLFTKEWTSAQTSLYALPKVPGIYIAEKKVTYNIQGLVTGATYLESKRLLILCGYNSLFHPFLWLFYDFNNYDFFSGNKRKVSVDLPFHQVEGITTNNGLKYYLSNEFLEFQSIASSPAKLHVLDLQALLQNYLSGSTESAAMKIHNKPLIFPNPTGSKITVRYPGRSYPFNYKLIDSAARIVLEGVFIDESLILNMSQLNPGNYYLWIEEQTGGCVSVLKL